MGIHGREKHIAIIDIDKRTKRTFNVEFLFFFSFKRRVLLAVFLNSNYYYHDNN